MSDEAAMAHDGRSRIKQEKMAMMQASYGPSTFPFAAWALHVGAVVVMLGISFMIEIKPFYHDLFMCNRPLIVCAASITWTLLLVEPAYAFCWALAWHFVDWWLRTSPVYTLRYLKRPLRIHTHRTRSPDLRRTLSLLPVCSQPPARLRSSCCGPRRGWSSRGGAPGVLRWRVCPAVASSWRRRGCPRWAHTASTAATCACRRCSSCLTQRNGRRWRVG